jgi:hypothetical protein
MIRHLQFFYWPIKPNGPKTPKPNGTTQMSPLSLAIPGAGANATSPMGGELVIPGAGATAASPMGEQEEPKRPPKAPGAKKGGTSTLPGTSGWGQTLHLTRHKKESKVERAARVIQLKFRRRAARRRAVVRKINQRKNLLGFRDAIRKMDRRYWRVSFSTHA